MKRHSYYRSPALCVYDPRWNQQKACLILTTRGNHHRDFFWQNSARGCLRSEKAARNNATWGGAKWEKCAKNYVMKASKENFKNKQCLPERGIDSAIYSIAENQSLSSSISKQKCWSLDSYQHSSVLKLWSIQKWERSDMSLGAGLLQLNKSLSGSEKQRSISMIMLWPGVVAALSRRGGRYFFIVAFISCIVLSRNILSMREI